MTGLDVRHTTKRLLDLTGDGGAVDQEVLSLIEGTVVGFLARRHDLRRLRQDEAPTSLLWPQMAELGLLGLSLSADLGGAGLGYQACTRVAEIMGRNLAPEPFAACGVMPAAVISALPDSDLRSRLAEELIGGEKRIAFAWQESQAQVCPWPANTYISEHGLITGQKIGVVCAEDRLLIAATHLGTPALALVSLKQADRVVMTTATDGTQVADVHFSGAEIEGHAPLLSGDEADHAIRHAHDAGILVASAQLTGLSSALFELTLNHLRTRTQFGRPIGAFQVLQHRAVDMRIKLALSAASVREATRLMDEAPRSSLTSAAVSAAKARSSATALLICREAVQMHGALGFTEESDVTLYTRAMLRLASWLGGPREHRRRFLACGGDDIHGC